MNPITIKLTPKQRDLVVDAAGVDPDDDGHSSPTLHAMFLADAIGDTVTLPADEWASIVADVLSWHALCDEPIRGDTRAAMNLYRDVVAMRPDLDQKIQQRAGLVVAAEATP